MNKDNDSILDDDLGMLRKKVEALPEVDFKRKLIGGVDQEDVVKYVNTISERLQRSDEVFKSRLEEVINSKRTLQAEVDNYKDKIKEAVVTTTRLNDDIRKLEKEKAALEGRILELEQEITRRNESFTLEEDLRSGYDSKIVGLEKERVILEDKVASLEEQLLKEKSEQSEQMALRIRVEHDLEIERTRVGEKNEEVTRLEACLNEAEKQLRESSRIIEEQKKVQADLEKEVKKDDAYIEVNISGIRNQIEVVYKQLENLQEMAKENRTLKNQLKQERLRADNAERDLKEFGKMLSELESKINPKTFLQTLKIG